VRSPLPPLEALSLSQNPFVVAGRKQFAPIQVVCLLKSGRECLPVIALRGILCLGNGLFELSNIEVKRHDGMPVQRLHACGGKSQAQLVEQLAKVVAGLGLGCIRPEEESQALALLRNIAMQDEIGEQGLQAHGIELVTC